MKSTRPLSHLRNPKFEANTFDIYNSQNADPSEKATLFRKYFKFYKQRKHKPDLSNVLNLRVSNKDKGLFCNPIDVSLLSDKEQEFLVKNTDFNPINSWTISKFVHRSGLYILNNVFTPSAQIEWIQNSLLTYCEPPNVTNLSVLGTYCKDKVFDNCGEKLRWVTMGNDYNWANKEYAKKPRQPLPEKFTHLGSLISNILGLTEMQPDAAIIHYYPDKANLSPHVDKSERDLSRPLISLSFGQSAIYLTGGNSLDDPIDAFFLHSGDILVMHAAQRLVYHSVPRILQTTVFEKLSHIEQKVVDYANKCRINLTLRQVDS